MPCMGTLRGLADGRRLLAVTPIRLIAKGLPEVQYVLNPRREVFTRACPGPRTAKGTLLAPYVRIRLPEMAILASLSSPWVALRDQTNRSI